jgi:hypothetical protein
MGLLRMREFVEVARLGVRDRQLQTRPDFAKRSVSLR